MNDNDYLERIGAIEPEKLIPFRLTPGVSVREYDLSPFIDGESSDLGFLDTSNLIGTIGRPCLNVTELYDRLCKEVDNHYIKSFRFKVINEPIHIQIDGRNPIAVAGRRDITVEVEYTGEKRTFQMHMDSEDIIMEAVLVRIEYERG